MRLIYTKSLVTLLMCFSSLYITAQTDYIESEYQFTEYLKALQPELALDFYLDDAYLLFQGKLLNGKEEISEALNELAHPDLACISILPVKHSESEVFHFVDLRSPKRNYSKVIAWKRVQGLWKKEMEIIEEIDYGPKAIPELDDARKRWVALSNSHDHTELVEGMYTSNAWYINNGKSYMGHSEISKKYAYMSSPSWEITLHPEWIAPIDQQTAIEVGKYVSSGIGHYVILWKKDSTGQVKVALDFNF